MPRPEKEQREKDAVPRSMFVPHGRMPDPFTLVMFGATRDLPHPARGRGRARLLCQTAGNVPRLGAHRRLSFDHAGAYGRPLPETYERLIFGALRGDPTLFMRADESEAAWGFVIPILETWAARGWKDLASYPAGSWGPSQADELARGCDGGWRRP